MIPEKIENVIHHAFMRPILFLPSLTKDEGRLFQFYTIDAMIVVSVSLLCQTNISQAKSRFNQNDREYLHSVYRAVVFFIRRNIFMTTIVV
jgi:hypothetical protein